MKRLLLCFLPLITSVSVWAVDRLANIVEFTPAAGWVLADPRQPMPPGAPTIKYVPADGRHAEILLTLMMSDNPRYPVTDLASLKRFNLMSATPYLPTPNAKPPTTELRVCDGFGVYMSNEDPSMVGKPLPPGEYRFATTATLYLSGKFIVHSTILHDAANSAEFKQAMQILSSAAVRDTVRAAIAKENTRPAAAAALENDPDAVSRPGLHAVLNLPSKRFQPSGIPGSSDPGYFSVVDEQGVMLSGWLDQAGKFKGMRTFWAAEKASLQDKAGIAVADESLKIINGWNAVLYTVPLGNQAQKNIRACRVAGDTWADVHLSGSSATATWKDLESVLAALTLTAKTP